MLSRDLTISIGLAIVLHTGVLAMLGVSLSNPVEAEPGALAINVVLLDTPMPEANLVRAMNEMSEWDETLPIESAASAMIEQDPSMLDPVVEKQAFAPESNALNPPESRATRMEVRDTRKATEVHTTNLTTAPPMLIDENVSTPREVVLPSNTPPRLEGVPESPPAQVESRATAPVVSSNPRPTYPTIAHRRGWEGIVELRVEVLANGRVGRIEVLRSAGHSVFDDAAMKAVRGWVFTPAMQLGRAVDRWIDVPVEFRLDE